MLRNLSELEAVRGPAERITASEPPQAVVRAAWPCGCVASGPAFDRLVLQDDACVTHRPQRSQTTLILRRADLT